MVALQIRDVPDDVRDVLAARARENGQSLQAFLLSLVLREASFARNLDLIKEIESWTETRGSTATAADVLDVLREARSGRDAVLDHPPGGPE